MPNVLTAQTISQGLALGILLPCLPLQCPSRSAPIADPKRYLQQELEQECATLTKITQRRDLTNSQRLLIEADRLLLEDPELHQALFAQLEQGLSPQQACLHVFNEYAKEFEQMSNPHLAHRGRDMLYMGERLARRLEGIVHHLPEQLHQDTLLVVSDLTVSEFIHLPKHHLCGVILERGNHDDHLGILLRSAGIPALVLKDALTRIKVGPALLDGDNGQLTLATRKADRQRFQTTLAKWQSRKAKYHACQNLTATTFEGERVWLRANIGNIEDTEQVNQYHLDGVGLLRSEYLYMAEGSWPDEAKQLMWYRSIARKLGDEPLTIRTFDFGVDKTLPELNIKEANPALGCRAIRLGLALPEKFKIQLRAVVRLAQDHPVRLLLPMVNQPEELNTVLSLLDQVKAELNCQPKLPIGIMVETPSAVMMLDAMAPMLDFASIGSNDLAQYSNAVDRNNANITPFYPQLSPAVIRLLHQLCQQAHKVDLPLSLCGELASEPLAIHLLLAMGLREFSITPPRSGEIKYQLRQYRAERGQALLHDALNCSYQRDLLTLLNDCVSR